MLGGPEPVDREVAEVDAEGASGARRLRSVDPSRIRADLMAAGEGELVELLARILRDALADETG